MGNLLTSGNGKGNSAISFWAIVYVVNAVLLYIVFCVVVPNQFRYATGRAEVSFAVGLIGAIISFVMGVVTARAVAATEIRVYENGIEGKGGGKGFIWGDPRLFSFQLAYNQITSVDVASTSVVIHAANAQYKCYVENGSKIQNAIFNQRNLQNNKS